MPHARSRNRLAAEPSLYLQQHASNPVDWYPWCDEALSRARAENKPILLSVGYSACHWCHVMERESFEDERIAALMNRLFICIKVDREERPDIDGIYMKAVQGMTGRGGWPMTVFMTPQCRPFYAGTYFPPEDRGGMPGFDRVLTSVARAFAEKPEEVAESADRVVAFLGDRSRDRGEAIELDRERLDRASRALVSIMDAEHGGFGAQPKFPGSLCLSFLMGMESEAPERERAALVRKALDRMADGGIYDHLGGGFHRYSVDRFWLVPHFEKMLYDQALLAPLYAEAWKLFGEPRYREVAQGVLDYVAREMTSPEGGFYSTQDADSEGEEGKFFVWTQEEIAETVGAADAALVCDFYGVSERGNFEGANILHRPGSCDDLAAAHGSSAGRVREIVERARGRLFERRERRVKPARDEKILADWNGLMIAAAASVGRLFERDDLVALAAAAADFCRHSMMRDGRLMHFHAAGLSRVSGFLDDYAFLGRGCLELFEAAGRKEDLDTAEQCARVLIEKFENREDGGFYFTPSDGEVQVARSSDLFDSAVPAGNSVAVELLLRLHELTGASEFAAAAERALNAFLAPALENPFGGGHLLAVAHRSLRGYACVVVAEGTRDDGDLARVALERHCPGLSVLSYGKSAGAEWLPAIASGKTARDGRQTAYLCRRGTCSAPVTTRADLESVLGC